MKALSVHQPWASMIARGDKGIETRTWPTNHRGELLIVSTKRPDPDHPDLPLGQALCVIELSDCRPMTREDEEDACCPCQPGLHSWIAKNTYRVKPFAVTGRQGLYDIDESQIEYE